MASTSDLGRFLASRRARLDPHMVGLPADGSRRVRGLRREEVAVLASISVDYYTQLEQGRAASPSERVLGALARVLHLGDDERAHLRTLAAAPRVDAAPSARPVRPGLVTLLDGLRLQAAFVVDHRMDVLAANRIADGLMGGWIAAGRHRGNLARYVFGDPDARSVHPDWHEVAAATAATLRYGAAHRSDEGLRALLEDLGTSASFAEVWERHDVAANTNGGKRFRLGAHTLDVDYEVALLPGDGDARLVVYSPRGDGMAVEAFAAIAAAAPAPWVVLPAPPVDSAF